MSRQLIYAIADNFELRWFRYDSKQIDVAGPITIGHGWDFKRVFSGGDGIIYAITHTGELLWYRHEGRDDGTPKWANDGTGASVGNGWDFKQVFSTGMGRSTSSVQTERCNGDTTRMARWHLLLD
jgi:hypothetical protein